MDLGSLLDPTSTAVLTMELQRGVVGDLAALSHLRDAAALVSMPANAGRICASARSAGATVVHCTAEFRPDRKGSATNARILGASQKLNGDRLDRGQPGTELIPELGADADDLRAARGDLAAVRGADGVGRRLAPLTAAGFPQSGAAPSRRLGR